MNSIKLGNELLQFIKSDLINHRVEGSIFNYKSPLLDTWRSFVNSLGIHDRRDRKRNSVGPRESIFLCEDYYRGWAGGGRSGEGAIWARDDKDLRGILRELRRHREKKKSLEGVNRNKVRSGAREVDPRLRRENKVGEGLGKGGEGREGRGV